MSEVLPNSFFRPLSEEEIEEFREWARENAVPEHFAKGGIYHPSVRDEWEKMGHDWRGEVVEEEEENNI